MKNELEPWEIKEAFDRALIRRMALKYNLDETQKDGLDEEARKIQEALARAKKNADVESIKKALMKRRSW